MFNIHKSLIPFLVFCNLFACLGQQTKMDTLIILDHLRANDLKENTIGNIFEKDAVQQLGGSATGLLSRISGVTFQGNALVSIRGLSPRYSTLTVDGLSAPITEQNIKAFALGLLPASAVQKLSVYKAGNYINHSEWGGAVVNISSNAEVLIDFNSLSANLGYQHNFTFSNFIKDADFGTEFGDVFGFAIDKRDFTKNIASREELTAMSRDEAAAEGAKLRNTWGIKKVTGMPNISLGYSMGRILAQNGDEKLSTINSIAYSSSLSGMHTNRAKYHNYERNENDEVISSELDGYMTDGIYKIKAELMLNSGWNYKMNNGHNINLDLSYGHSTVSTAMTRYYVGLSNNKEVFYTQFGAVAKGVFLARLTGDHNFGDHADMNWSLGYANSSRREPDLRRGAAQRNLNAPDDPFLLVIPESSKADLGARFSSDLGENSISGRVDFNHNFIDHLFELKAGFIGESTNRDFAARIITSAKDDFTSPDLRFVTWDQFSTIYAPENYGPEGYYLVDGTTDFDKYSASSTLLGFYAGIDNTFFENQLNSSVGVRVENYGQTLESGDTDVNNNNTNVLPYINLNWRPGHNSSLKLSYCISVNRPAFRELAPFSFYDFDYRADIQGNSELKNATIHNVDINYLYNFGRDEYFSLGAFYKQLTNPIEMIYIIRSDSPLFSFDNAKGAEVGGVELEFLKFLSDNPNSVLYNLLFNGNLAYTSSQIELGENTNEVSSNRPLQGQTPLIVALGLTYIVPSFPAQVTASYKHVGKSLYSVGDGQETFPWYNAPTHTLNCGFSYRFKNNISLKFFANNLLNTPMKQVEDTNLNGKIKDEVDKDVMYGLTYQSFSITVGYKF